MTGLKIGYARVSTDAQDLTVQREALAALGVDPQRVYVDHGLTGTNRARPGLREAMAACRNGDTLVVTKLDRLARSVPDARDIVDELTARGVRLNLGGSIHDPSDPIGRLLFTVLSMIAEFEADLARSRTREGMAVAKAKGRLRGKQPKLSPKQEEWVAMAALISHTSFDSFNAHASSVFWGEVLGFAEDPDDPNEPGDEECMIFSADGTQRLLFIEVPDAKQVKNRVHLDLKPAEGTREQELERLLGLGAHQVADRRRPDGSGWIVLADPEGNEFCILRSDAERAASA